MESKVDLREEVGVLADEKSNKQHTDDINPTLCRVVHSSYWLF